MPLATAAPHLRRVIDALAVGSGLPVWRSQRYRMAFLPGEWLEGQILTESNGNPRARRYEAHQDRAVRAHLAIDPDTPDHDDGEIEDDASYGLMQVMGYNIRALVGVAPGIRMNFDWALLPFSNIVLGIRVLKFELGQVGNDVERALARYNGGPTGDDPDPRLDGDMRLRRYVDKVAENSRRVIIDRDQLGWRSLEPEH